MLFALVICPYILLLIGEKSEVLLISMLIISLWLVGIYFSEASRWLPLTDLHSIPCNKTISVVANILLHRRMQENEGGGGGCLLS